MPVKDPDFCSTDVYRQLVVLAAGHKCTHGAFLACCRICVQGSITCAQDLGAFGLHNMDENPVQGNSQSDCLDFAGFSSWHLPTGTEVLAEAFGKIGKSPYLWTRDCLNSSLGIEPKAVFRATDPSFLKPAWSFPKYSDSPAQETSEWLACNLPTTESKPMGL